MPHVQSPPSRQHRCIMGMSLVIVVLVLGYLDVVVHHAGSKRNTVATSAITPASLLDPRLILHPHTLPFAARLTHRLQLIGTLAPDLPGINTITLALDGVASEEGRASTIQVMATMPGMVMAPVHVLLDRDDGSYSNTMRLPMFGTYVLAVEVSTTTGIVTGMFSITLSLPGR